MPAVTHEPPGAGDGRPAVADGVAPAVGGDDAAAVGDTAATGVGATVGVIDGVGAGPVGRAIDDVGAIDALGDGEADEAWHAAARMTTIPSATAARF
ncbi:MAG: hypothetical protein WCH74_03060 [Chloroflexota bacterium]